MFRRLAHLVVVAASAAGSTGQSLSELDWDRGLWSAAKAGDLGRAQELLGRRGVDDKDRSGYTPLHYAARNNKGAMVTLLLENNADVNARVSTFGTFTPVDSPIAPLPSPSSPKIFFEYR